MKIHAISSRFPSSSCVSPPGPPAHLSSLGMLSLLGELGDGPQVFPSWATGESLAKALVTVACVPRRLQILLVLGGALSSDATLNPSDAAQWSMAPYTPRARPVAQGWGFVVPEGFRLCQQGLFKQTWCRGALPWGAMLWAGLGRAGCVLGSA